MVKTLTRHLLPSTQPLPSRHRRVTFSSPITDGSIAATLMNMFVSVKCCKMAMALLNGSHSPAPLSSQHFLLPTTDATLYFGFAKSIFFQEYHCFAQRSPDVLKSFGYATLAGNRFKNSTDLSLPILLSTMSSTQASPSATEIFFSLGSAQTSCSHRSQQSFCSSISNCNGSRPLGCVLSPNSNLAVSLLLKLLWEPASRL